MRYEFRTNRTRYVQINSPCWSFCWNICAKLTVLETTLNNIEDWMTYRITDSWDRYRHKSLFCSCFFQRLWRIISILFDTKSKVQKQIYDSYVTCPYYMPRNLQLYFSSEEPLNMIARRKRNVFRFALTALLEWT